LLEKIQKHLAEFTEIEKKLVQQKIVADQKKFRVLSIRHAELSENIDIFREFVTATKNLNEAQKILNSNDIELRDLATAEKLDAGGKIAELTIKIKIALLPRDPADQKNVIIEVRAGTGGEEAALFASELARGYLRFAEANKFKTEILTKSEADAGGVKEIIFRVEGLGAFAKLKFEAGTHRVQRIPKTESKGRIHTSAVTVAVLPEAEDVDVKIKPEDLRIDTFCASGAGGQHVNRTESAVRIMHLPTEIVVSCQNARSQFQNREQALRMLRSKLFEFEREQAAAERGAARAAMVGSGDRSEKIRTYNFPQDRITDHRIGKNFSNLPKILAGEFAEIVEECVASEIAEKMKMV
jgi:peptide chain release factor 1